MPIDLLRELPRAARAPAGEADRLISIQVVDHEGTPRPALVMQATSRVIWQVQMREVAEFRADLARLPGGDAGAELMVRIGVSDERLYEDYFHERLAAPAGGAPEWQPVTIDLSLYSGRKWSVFYQPSRRTWSLVLNVQGGDATVALVEPRIEGDGARPVENSRRIASHDPGSFPQAEPRPPTPRSQAARWTPTARLPSRTPDRPSR